MNESGEEMAAESGDEALARLGDAVGQPPLSVLENAKALFSFISEASEDTDAPVDDSVPSAPAASTPAVGPVGG